MATRLSGVTVLAILFVCLERPQRRILYFAKCQFLARIIAILIASAKPQSAEVVNYCLSTPSCEPSVLHRFTKRLIFLAKYLRNDPVGVTPQNAKTHSNACCYRFKYRSDFLEVVAALSGLEELWTSSN